MLRRDNAYATGPAGCERVPAVDGEQTNSSGYGLFSVSGRHHHLVAAPGVEPDRRDAWPDRPRPVRTRLPLGRSSWCRTERHGHILARRTHKGVRSAVQKPPDPWDRAYEKARVLPSGVRPSGSRAFCAYLGLPRGRRSLARAATSVGKSRWLLGRWSRRWQWQDRVRRHDALAPRQSRLGQVGARSRLTGSVVPEILRALAEGLLLPQAARAAGIPANTVGEWMRRGYGPRSPRAPRCWLELPDDSDRSRIRKEVGPPRRGE
jgi:hypothetical protein